MLEKIWYLDDFLREVDREYLANWLLIHGNWSRSLVGNQSQNKFNYEDQSRTSDTLYQGSMPAEVETFLRGLSHTLAEAVGRPASHLEGWQAVRYLPGCKFDAHHDPGLSPGNERELTVIITLQQAEDGGHTYFPNLKYAVNSQNRRLLVWNNLREDASVHPDSLHAGLPVVRGEKLILVNWFLQRPR